MFYNLGQDEASQLELFMKHPPALERDTEEEITSWLGNCCLGARPAAIVTV